MGRVGSLGPPPRTATAGAGTGMIRLGTALAPNAAGKQHPAFTAGWSETDPGGFVWIQDAAAEMALDMPPVLGDLAVEVDCFPIELSGATPQRLTLFGGGLFLGSRLLLGRALLVFPLPREVAATRTLRLALVPGMIEIPKRAGRGPDERALSIGVFSVCLRNAN